MDKWIGPYHLINFIDPGGHSAVFRAYKKDSQGDVAIKIMHERFPNRDPAAKEKFLKEVKILEALDHAHIVKLIDAIFDDTDYDEMARPCIVMPFLPGGTLRKLLNNDGLLPLETIRSYTCQIADALQYVHSCNVMHCDVKPENILLSKDGSSVFLADFGIAQILSEIHSTTHVTTNPSGTDAYMAPEQFEGQPSMKSDQYALAVLIYECLCGFLPFAGTNYAQFSQQHRHARVPSLRQKCRILGRNISKRTEQVVLKALAKEKDKRYPNIKEFAAALDKALALDIASTPISVSPAQLTAKSINVWAFGKRQFVMTLMLAVCYSIISYTVIFLLIPGSSSEINFDFEFSFFLFLPIFFASFFGPWVGIGATGIGFFLADFIEWLRHPFPFFSLQVPFPWWNAPLLMLVAFFAGLFLLKTKGQYHKFGNLLFASLLGLLDLCFAFMVVDIIVTITPGQPNLFSYFFTDIWAINLPALIFLPLLLLLSNAIRSVWNRRSTQYARSNVI